MTSDACDRDSWRHSDEDQQRRHEEPAADTEHARNETDRQSHRQHEEDVHGQIGDREIDLHARVRWLRERIFDTENEQSHERCVARGFVLSLPICWRGSRPLSRVTIE